MPEPNHQNDKTMYNEGGPVGTGEGGYGGSGAAAAGGLISLVNAGASIYNTYQTNKANKQLAEYSYSQEREQQDRINAYNSPQAQMQRYTEAGLNPNLIYGTGHASAGNQTTMPKYNAPRMEYNYQLPLENIPGTIAMFQDYRLKQQQLSNMKKQGDLIDENITNKRFGNRWEDLMQNDPNKIKYRQALAAMGIREADFNYKEQAVEKRATELGWFREHGAELMDTQLEYAGGRVHAQSVGIQKALADIARIKADTNYKNLQAEYYDAQILAQLGSGIVGTLSKMGSFFKGAKKSTGAKLSGSTNRSFNETTRRMKEFGKRQGY